MTSVNAVDIGVGATSVGLVNVSGVGSTLSVLGTSFLNIGRLGSGSLIIRDGGRVTAGIVEMAFNASGVGTLSIDGVGSRLDVAGPLNALSGDTTIAISNGGVLTTTDFISIFAGARVTLDGGRWESTAPANISGVLEGSGTMDVPDINLTGPGPKRLHTSAGDRLILTGQLDNDFGLVDLAGGELDVRGVLLNSSDIDARDGATLRVGGAGLDNDSGAQLAITGGSVDVFGAVDNNADAEIAVTGGSTATFHDGVTNNGTIFVSASSEIVLLENLSFVPSSTLGVELASISPAADPTDVLGLVNISGASALAGTLSISLASGFAPTLGDSYEIVRASGGLSGAFAVESLPALGGGLGFDVLYTPTAVVLSVVSAPQFSADFDEDGDVDGDDLNTRWKPGFGASSTIADADDDGDSDGADFLEWQRQVGSGLAVAAGGVVPEPGAMVLATLAAGILVYRRRRLDR